MNNIDKTLIREIYLLTDSFNKKKIHFSYFVSRLKELFENLENASDEWRKKSRELWFVLEEVNAVLLDPSSKYNIEDFKTLIHNTIIDFENHIASLNTSKSTR